MNVSKGYSLALRGFIRPILKQDLAQIGINLQTPLIKNMKDERPKSFVKLLNRRRRLVLTVIGHYTSRFEIEKTKARDLCHLTNRMTRKILAHTALVFLNK